MNDLFMKLFLLLLLFVWYIIGRIEENGWFRTTSKWARSIDERIEDMFHASDFHCPNDYFISKAFRRDCADFLEARLSSKATKSDRNATKAYYSSDIGFYTMLAARAYRKLLFSPFALYSELSWEAKAAYHQIYKYAVHKLISLGVYDTAFYEKAENQLQTVEEFCLEQKNSKNFIEW